MQFSTETATQDMEREADWRSQVLEVPREGDEVISGFSKIAPVYELFVRFAESGPRRRVLELASVEDGESILEVATGTGSQLVKLAGLNLSGRTVGVELADGMLAQTRKRLASAGLSEVELHKADARNMPFADETFDLVTNGYMLDLMPRDEIPRTLAEFKRVLKPGGRLVLSNMTKGKSRRHQFWDALYRRGVRLTGPCRGVLAEPVLRQLGFEDVRREYMTQMLFPSEIITARKASGP